MKLYKNIEEKDSKSIKILNFPIYTKIKTGDVVKRKYFLGIYKIRELIDSKQYYILGIKIGNKKLKKILPPQKANANKQAEKLKPVFNPVNAFIMEYFCNLQQIKYKDKPLDINELLNNSKSVMLSCSTNYMNHAHGWAKYLFKGKLHSIDTLPYDNKNADLYVLLGGVGQTPAQINVVIESLQCNKPCLIMEAAFLRSINTFCEQKGDAKYRYDIGFVMDYLTAYYDATRPSHLENLLNDTNIVITEEQKQRARNCINRIIENHLTKYNCQPIVKPNIGREGKKKVLVVDQSFGDNSIKKGLASVNTFEEMLEAAILENPDADIIIKTHPDTKTGQRTGYYTGIKNEENIFLYTDAINPISLVNYVDKVYVCTTQMGFEALMCNKEVHIFGMPFYAGWGYTNDRQVCERRTNKRTLEEIFYIAYIMYSYYVNPATGRLCEIEEAMDILLNLRKEYFELNNIKMEQ